MSKMPLEGNNTEEFLNRFILTQVNHQQVLHSVCVPFIYLHCLFSIFQIFSEHAYRQSQLSPTAPPVPSHPAPPVPEFPYAAQTQTNTNTNTNFHTNTSTLSATSTTATAASISTITAADLLPTSAADRVAGVATATSSPSVGAPQSNPASPDSVGSRRKSIPRGVTFSSPSDDEPTSENEAIPSAEALALLSHVESVPRNNLEMRRRSVDMEFRKSVREVSEKLNSSQADGEGESEEE